MYAKKEQNGNVAMISDIVRNFTTIYFFLSNCQTPVSIKIINKSEQIMGWGESRLLRIEFGGVLERFCVVVVKNVASFSRKSAANR